MMLLFPQRSVISAPFGNYLNYTGAISTLGTFTWKKRDGWLGLYKWWRVFKTLRSFPALGAWVNKLGLPNPGWLAFEKACEEGKYKPSNHIISIHGFNESEWQDLIFHAYNLRPAAIELNISCPNVGEDPLSAAAGAFKAAGEALKYMTFRNKLIVKLPPLRYEEILREALNCKIRTFHCCNTLPVPGGGMSGKPLKPLSLHCIKEVARLRSEYDIEIIGGGGISDFSDCRDYILAGVDYVAFGSMLFDRINRENMPELVRSVRSAWNRVLETYEEESTPES